MRGAIAPSAIHFHKCIVSIRAPLAGSDLRVSYGGVACCGFNPRPPCGERFSGFLTHECIVGFNPRPPCGERFHWFYFVRSYTRVSIRAPLAGSDRRPTPQVRRAWSFNPRPPCGERSHEVGKRWTASKFQSAPPLRGAITKSNEGADFSRVSIRAPLAGSDKRKAIPWQGRKSFNPRPPCGERLSACGGP